MVMTAPRTHAHVPQLHYEDDGLLGIRQHPITIRPSSAIARFLSTLSAAAQGRAKRSAPLPDVSQ